MAAEDPPNIWARKRRKVLGNQRNVNTFDEKFDSWSSSNFGVDIDSKRAILKVSRSVVSVVSYLDEEPLFMGSGTIIKCMEPGDSEGKYTCIVMTSFSVLRSPTGETVPLDGIVVSVYLPICTEPYDADLEHMKYDAHYNLLFIKIHLPDPWPAAILKPLNDVVTIGNETPSSGSGFSIFPGVKLIALGRDHTEPYDLMASPGVFSLERWDGHHCFELMRSTCQITKQGIGGPLINGEGEVIGIAHYDLCETPFLPINIALKCWLTKVPSPWIGIRATNLYAISIEQLERMRMTLPDVTEGVVVEKVILMSRAYRAGLRAGDIIIQLDGKTVSGFLSFLEMIMDNVGKFVNLVVVRESRKGRFRFRLYVEAAKAKNMYRWPLPKVYSISIPGRW